jgi:hypothetical protein
VSIYLAAGTVDLTTAGVEVTGRIADLWTLLVFKNNVMFQTVITPFKLIVGTLFLYNTLPLLSMNHHHVQQIYKSLLGMILVLVLFLNNGDGMRKFGVIQYAVARGSADSIDLSFDSVTNTAKLSQDLAGSEVAIKEINKNIETCLALSPLINGTPNPAYTDCSNKVKALVQKGLNDGVLNDTSAGGLWKSGVANPDILAGLGQIVQAGSKLLDDATMALPRAILNGMKNANTMIGEFAMLVSVLSSPIPLSLSMLNPKPLMGWISTFWGGAIFTIAYSIVSGLFNYLNAVAPQSLGLLGFDICLAIISPLIAGAIASGGGLSVYLAFQQAATATAQAAATAAKL